MIEALDKESISLRISVTDRCQLRCIYCMPEDGVPFCDKKKILSYEQITAFVSALQNEYNLQKVRITGGDPLERKNIIHLVELLSDLQIPDIAMTTNGQNLSSMASDLKKAGLNRVNISLDSLLPETFARVTRGNGSLEKTIRGIEQAILCGLAPLKINMVVLKGINDSELAQMAAFASEKGCLIRFLELMPIGISSELFAQHYISTDDMIAMLADSYDLEPLPDMKGSTSRVYCATDKHGNSSSIGFISPNSHPFCCDCRRLRLTAKGSLVGCLTASDAIDVTPIINEIMSGHHVSIKGTIEKAIRNKKSKPQFERKELMASIGG